MPLRCRAQKLVSTGRTTGATGAFLTQFVPELPHAGRGEQTRVVVEKLDGDLERVGLGFGDVLGRWSFLHDILA